MFTICFMVFTGFAAVPSSEHCEKVTAASVSASTIMCASIQSQDEHRTCDTHHTPGSTLWVHSIREFGW